MPKRQSTNPLSPDSIPLLVTKSKLKEKMKTTGSAAADAAATTIETAKSSNKNTKKNPEKLKGIKKHDLRSTVQLSSNEVLSEVSNIDAIISDNDSITGKPVGQSPHGDKLLKSDEKDEEEDNEDEDQKDVNEDEEEQDEDNEDDEDHYNNSNSEQDDDNDDNEDEENDQSSLSLSDKQSKTAIYSSSDSLSRKKALNVSGSIASIQSHLDCNNCYKLREELANTKLKFEGLMTTQHEWEAGKMHRKLGILENELENKENELLKAKYDMEILGQKLIEEIEKRAEITAASDSVQGELEELTQSLFEEANTLVANEARQRHGAQVKQEALAQQLHEVNMQLQIEQEKSRELRLRIAQLEQEEEETQHHASSHRPSKANVSLSLARISTDAGPLNQKISSIFSLTAESLASLNPDDLIDSYLFEQFVDLIDRAPKVKMTKIHDIPFMHHALEDDVSPCLRFGGNPRTSTKKFIDAIVANTCFIELMNEEQIQELVQRDEKKKQASISVVKQGTSTTKTSPTMALFNKTVLERISNALSSQTSDLSASLGGTGMNNGETPGCSTCGRQESYQFRFKISDVQQDVWYPICTDCQFRLLAVLDFYQFIRNMRQGLFSTRSRQDLYLEALCYKRIMFFARIGCGGKKHADILFHLLEHDLNPVEERFSPETPEGGVGGDRGEVE